MKSTIQVLLLLLGFINNFGQHMHGSGGALRPLQAIMDIRHYKIVLDIDTTTRSINGYTEIDLVLAKSSDTLLFDLGSSFNVSGAQVDNRKTACIRKGDLLYILPASPVESGRRKIRIYYKGAPQVALSPPHEGGFIWTRDLKNNLWLSMACQFEGGKIYFPCKDHPSDEPNEGAELIITVPKGLVVAGPGLLKNTAHTARKSTYHWKTDYTINNYSIVFSAAKFKVAKKTYTTINGNKVPMEAYTLEENTDKGMGLLNRLEVYGKMLEKYYGEYPWVKEKIGVCEAPFLGMEHQTMIAYGNRFRYDEKDSIYDNVLLHEFAHEWWGNKLTCKDWSHMWLHEGIATFSENLYFREKEGVAAYNNRWRFRKYNPGGKPIIQRSDADIIQIYDGGTLYSKSATFMRILQTVMEDSLFFLSLKKLITDLRYTYDSMITTEDVEDLFSSLSGQHLKPIFDLYLRTSNNLEVNVDQTVQYGKEEKIYTLWLNNIDASIPMDILTDKGIQRMIISKKGQSVLSKTLPEVDPYGYYLKKVIYE